MLVLILWETVSKSQDELNITSTIHVNNQTWKQLKSINVPKKLTPKETTQKSQIAYQGKAWTNKAYCRAKRSASCSSQGPPVENAPIPPHVYLHKPGANPKVTPLWKASFHLQVLLSLTCTLDPSPGQATLDKNIPHGLRHLNNKLGAEGEAHTLFPEDQSHCSHRRLAQNSKNYQMRPKQRPFVYQHRITQLQTSWPREPSGLKRGPLLGHDSRLRPSTEQAGRHKTASAALITLSTTLARAKARRRQQGPKRQQQEILEKAALPNYKKAANQ